MWESPARASAQRTDPTVQGMRIDADAVAMINADRDKRRLYIRGKDCSPKSSCERRYRNIRDNATPHSELLLTLKKLTTSQCAYLKYLKNNVM